MNTTMMDRRRAGLLVPAYALRHPHDFGIGDSRRTEDDHERGMVIFRGWVSQCRTDCVGYGLGLMGNALLRDELTS